MTGERARSATGLPPRHRASPAQWRGRPIGAKARRPSSSPADTAKGTGHCARALPCLPAALPGRFPHCGRVVRGQPSAHAADAAARSADALPLSLQQQRPSDPLAHATCANAARYPVDSSSSSPLFQPSPLLPFSLVLMPLSPSNDFHRPSLVSWGHVVPLPGPALLVPLHRRALRSYYAALKDLWLWPSSWSERRGLAK
ncbi:hypothetical protein MTO96_003351 [Rhipicephalus appendiculatus]